MGDSEVVWWSRFPKIGTTDYNRLQPTTTFTYAGTNAQGAFEKLSKELQAQLEKPKCSPRKALSRGGRTLWRVQISSLPFGGNWTLNLGNQNELKARAREQVGKEVVITSTIIADGNPTVNVESRKRAEE